MSFQFNFTQDKFNRIIKNSDTSWYDVVYSSLPNYEINTVYRVAAWLAQTGHESNDFRWLVENLNYDAGGLMRVFPYYFPNSTLANQYAHNPEMIANYVYANRMGNGDPSTGDGWNFRGRGIIQITGRDNYTSCSYSIYQDDTAVKTPSVLAETNGAINSACWFWTTNNLNSYADTQDIETMTRRINGGLNGLSDRLARYRTALSILEGN